MPTMPLWAQWIIGISVLAGAATAIWKTLLRPLGKLIVYLHDALPLLRDLTAEFKDSPSSFKILEEIAAQFRTDSGSSLRDAVNRLEKAAAESKEAATANDAAASLLRVNAQVIAENVEAVKALARQDREEDAKRMLLMEALLAKFDKAEQNHAKPPNA